jgi:hypothetical protein
MKATDYEQLVAELAHKLVSQPNPGELVTVGWGSKNRIVGASGFKHQIDVSVRDPSRMLLIECKYWKDRIDPEACLAFAARVLDIRDVNKGREVTGRIVTTRSVTKGVRQIADYFNLGVDAVSSTQEYVMRIWHYVGIGLTEGARASDAFIANVRKAGMG